MGLRNLAGPKPQWRWNKDTGKITRGKNRGGIDWYRYQAVILKKNLILFALECMRSRPMTVVQEDKCQLLAYLVTMGQCSSVKCS